LSPKSVVDNISSTPVETAEEKKRQIENDAKFAIALSIVESASPATTTSSTSSGSKKRPTDDDNVPDDHVNANESSNNAPTKRAKKQSLVVEPSIEPIIDLTLPQQQLQQQQQQRQEKLENLERHQQAVPPALRKAGTHVALAIPAVPPNWQYQCPDAAAIRTVVARIEGHELHLHRVMNGIPEASVEKFSYNHITMRSMGLPEAPKPGAFVWASVQLIANDDDEDEAVTGVSDVLYRGEVVRAQGSRTVDVKFDDGEQGSKIPLSDCALE
jgi:hypothetical protein